MSETKKRQIYQQIGNGPLRKVNMKRLAEMSFRQKPCSPTCNPCGHTTKATK